MTLATSQFSRRNHLAWGGPPTSTDNKTTLKGTTDWLHHCSWHMPTVTLQCACKGELNCQRGTNSMGVWTSVPRHRTTVMGLSIISSSWRVTGQAILNDQFTHPPLFERKKIKVCMFSSWPGLAFRLQFTPVQQKGEQLWYSIRLYIIYFFQEMISFWMLWLKLVVGSGMWWHLFVCLSVCAGNLIPKSLSLNYLALPDCYDTYTQTHILLHWEAAVR